MIKKIMVPLDGSRAGGKAAIFAEELAKKLGSELILFRAVSKSTAPAVELAATGG